MRTEKPWGAVLGALAALVLSPQALQADTTAVSPSTGLPAESASAMMQAEPVAEPAAFAATGISPNGRRMEAAPAAEVVQEVDDVLGTVESSGAISSPATHAASAVVPERDAPAEPSFAATGLSQ